MATKPKQQKSAEAAQPESIGQMIPIGWLYPSPTNPRKRFPEGPLNELAGSIKDKGVLEPLIVRVGAKDGDYEIVCGERRYRAAKIAGLETAPCIVRELSDEEVLDIQIHENLHREDVHPMDEAIGYKFLMDTLNCDVKEVALRVGKNEAFVLGRLKLNQLIPEAQDDIEAGHLPLVYALEIAKFPPETQLQVLEEAYESRNEYVDGTWKIVIYRGQLEPFAKWKSWIDQKVLLLLSSAPFSPKATDLRSDGLACTNCPSRTGANASLFEADQIGKNDSCLNRTCFEAKSVAFAIKTRERLAHEASIEVDEVPVVNSASWSNSETFLGYSTFTQIVKKAKNHTESSKSCQSSVTAVDMATENYGQAVEVCFKDSKCKIHHKDTSSSSSGSANSQKTVEAEQLKKRIRKEELIDMNVGKNVRLQVLSRSAQKFAETFSMSNEDTAFLPMLLTRLFTTSSAGTDSHVVSKVIKPIIQDITDEPNALDFGSWASEEKVLITVSRLSIKNQRIILFLFVHGNIGAMFNDRYEPQTAIKLMAKENGIDYRLLDAQARVAFTSEKHKKHIELYKTFLAAVEAGTEAAIPRPYEPTYSPVDSDE